MLSHTALIGADTICGTESRSLSRWLLQRRFKRGIRMIDAVADDTER